MAVYRAEHKKYYTVISNGYLNDKRLSLGARGLMTIILSLPNNWNYTIKGLANHTGQGVAVIRSALKELEGCGYVKRYQLQNSDGKFSKTVYDIYEIPQDPSSEPTPVPSDRIPLPMNKPSCKKCRASNQQSLPIQTPTSPVFTLRTSTVFVQQNTNVTKELIKPKESKKQASHPEKPRKSFDELIDEFTGNELLRTALRAWLQTRYRQRKPLTNTSLQMALARLTRAASGAIDAMIEIVETAVVNGWCDFRPIPNKNNQYAQNGQYHPTAQSGKRVSAQNYRQREYTDEDLNALLVDISTLDDFCV